MTYVQSLHDVPDFQYNKHPWSDGNGRISRSLQTLLIARGGVLAPEFSSIEEWLGMPGNTWEYYKVLRDVGGRVRRARYEKAETLNTQQATRDLQALVKADILTPVGQTKGRHSRRSAGDHARGAVRGQTSKAGYARVRRGGRPMGLGKGMVSDVRTWSARRVRRVRSWAASAGVRVR